MDKKEKIVMLICAGSACVWGRFAHMRGKVPALKHI